MRRRTEEHTNHERWLVSYADFITLLFAFFVVMYAVLLVEDDRQVVYSKTLFDLFNNPDSSIKPPLPNQQSGQEIDEFKLLENKLEQEFADQIAQGTIKLEQSKGFLAIDFDAKILFDSGKAIPHTEALPLIRKIGSVLKDDLHAVQVAGFTDDAPINNALYPSNWELSSARAAKIVRLLTEVEIAPERLSAIGYGQFQPQADNRTADGRLNNRRVVIRVVKNV